MAMAAQQLYSTSPRTKNLGLQTRYTRLSHMTLRNFKGHKELDLDLGRITVLIGPTGSGKSTALQALLVLRAALEAEAVPKSGGAFDYGEFQDIVTDRDVSRAIRIGITGEKITSKDGAPDIASSFSYNVEFGSSGWLGKVDATVEMKRGTDASSPYEMKLEHVYSGGKNLTTITGAWMTAGDRKMVRADSGFVPRVHEYPNDDQMADAFAGAFTDGEYFSTLLTDIHSVPFSRVVTSYALPIEYDIDMLSADRTKGASSLLSWISTNPPLQNKVSDLLEYMGLKRIVARNIPVTGKGEKTMTVDFMGCRSSSAIVHEGSGSNQLIMLLVVLAGSPKGSVITIEEPEIHLDPETQSKLADVIVKLSVEENKQIIFTSHSSHLLYPLLGYVRKEECPITNNDLVINYFDTDDTGEVAGAERLDINERGQVKGGLRGFWSANMKALDDLLG